MTEDFGYQLEAVKAARVASDDIDKTFRSSSIGTSKSITMFNAASSYTDNYRLTYTQCQI